MITQIDLNYFKCFEVIKMPITNLTLLSGSNASGKSSFLQALVLLHQSVRENEWASRLMLNGETLRLGTVLDVVNKVHGRHKFDISIVDNENTFTWHFSGDRTEMSMAVDSVRIDDKVIDVPEKLFKLLPLDTTGQNYSLSNTLEGMTYITAERLGPRDFYKLEDPWKVKTVGSVGEHAVSMLHSLRDQTVDHQLLIETEPPTLLRQVEARMREFFPGCGMVVEPISKMNAVTLGLRTSNATDYHRPINVGFGLTQILPIIVATLAAKPGELILIENPEVHLHPAGQAMMGSYLSEVANAGVQIIIETHSDHVLNGIRRGVKKGLLKPEEVSLHFFRPPSEDLDQVVSPVLDSSGNIDSWPEGFFDQFDKDMNHFAGWGE